MRSLQAQLAQAEAERVAERLARYEHDPAAFAADCIIWPDGTGLAPYQEEALAELPARKRVSLRGPHGLGKTAIMSIGLLWFALTRDGRDWKAPTTASAWRQLTEFLWPEVHLWSRRLRWDIIGRAPFNNRTELQVLTLRLATGAAFALTSDTPTSLEGAHAQHLLYIFDEAKAIPAATFDAAEGAFSTGEAFALACSTPGEPNGRFYELHARAAGRENWWVRHVTVDEAIAAGRVKEDWRADAGRLWGVGSAIYQNRVLGEFAAGAEDSVVPLAWIEDANERWREWDASGRPGKFAALGVDVARSGEDSTVLAERFGDAVADLRRSRLEDTTQTTSRTQAVLRPHAAGRAVVDVIGIGAGVFDQLRQLKATGDEHLRRMSIEAFNASAKTDRRDRSREFGFINCRAAGWWNLRELLDPAFGSTLALPPDDELTGDLTAPRWWVAAGGRIQVESKDDVRKRIGRSTDAADAVIQAFWSESKPAKSYGRQVSDARLEPSPTR